MGYVLSLPFARNSSTERALACVAKDHRTHKRKRAPFPFVEKSGLWICAVGVRFVRTGKQRTLPTQAV